MSSGHAIHVVGNLKRHETAPRDAAQGASNSDDGEVTRPKGSRGHGFRSMSARRLSVRCAGRQLWVDLNRSHP